MYVYAFKYYELYFLYTFKLIIDIYSIVVYRPIYPVCRHYYVYRSPQPI